MSDTENEKKRKREDKSSISDLDESLTQLSGKNRKDRKKAAKQEKKKLKQKEDKLVEEGISTENMDSIQKELKAINHSLSKVMLKDDPKLEQLIKSTFDNMKEEFLKSVSHRIDVLEGKLFEKEKENDKLKQSVQTLEDKIKEKDEENKQLKNQLQRSEYNMKEQFNALEQHGRRNSIRLDGVAEKYGAEETAEQTAKIVVETLNSHMTDLNLKLGDIDIAHRLGKPKEGKKAGKRQIIVKFVSRMHTGYILRNKKIMKDTDIYISEDLTKLNWQALMCVRKKCPDSIENAWTREGRVRYKNKAGNLHTLRFEEYQTWFDMPWPEA